MGIKRFVRSHIGWGILKLANPGGGYTELLASQDGYGNARVSLAYGGVLTQQHAGNADNLDKNYIGTVTHSRMVVFNGDAADRLRGNTVGTLLASAARTATTSSADQTNYNAKGIIVVFDVTSVPGTDTVQLKVQAKDPASGKYIDMVTGTAESAAGTYVYAVYPGIGDKNTILDNYEELPLPRTWRVQVVHSAATSFTYSVGVMYVL